MKSTLLLLAPAALLIGLIAWVEPLLVQRSAAPSTVATATATAGLPSGAVATAEKSAVREDLLRVATPATPWKTVDAARRLTRIGVGSCLDQRRAQPIWRSVAKAKPDLFLMIGDNVYGDVKNDDSRELAEAYQQQWRQPEFAAARAEIPMLGIWDDHDYGLNDGGADFKHRDAAAALFRAFWTLPSASGAPGVASARTFGPAGQRVQIIMLDTRSFRSPLKRKDGAFPYWGKYAPDPDPAKSMLGAEQWAWLAKQLNEPADIRIIASSIQVLAEGHGHERWGNLPAERERLLKLIDETGARGVLLLSGDRHSAALYTRRLNRSQTLFELTSSSLNRPYGPSQDGRTPELVSDIHHSENFGIVAIDWERRAVTLSLQGLDGEDLDAITVRFADLGL